MCQPVFTFYPAVLKQTKIKTQTTTRCPPRRPSQKAPCSRSSAGQRPPLRRRPTPSTQSTVSPLVGQNEVDVNCKWRIELKSKIVGLSQSMYATSAEMLPAFGNVAEKKAWHAMFEKTVEMVWLGLWLLTERRIVGTITCVCTSIPQLVES